MRSTVGEIFGWRNDGNGCSDLSRAKENRDEGMFRLRQRGLKNRYYYNARFDN